MNSIAIFVNYIYPEYSGGVSWYVHSLSKHFAKRNYKVEVYTCTKDNTKKKEENADNVMIHNLFLEKGNLGLLRFKNRKNFYKSYKDKLSNYNVLNIHGVAFIPLREIYKNRRKIIFTCHGSQFREIVYDIKKQFRYYLLRPHELFRETIKALYSYFLESMTFSLAREIIVMSNFSKSYISNTYPFINKNKFKIIPIGIDLPARTLTNEDKYELRDKYNIAKEKTVFFTLRRLVPRMGIKLLINSISKIIKDKSISENLLFVIAGKGNLESEVKILIDDSGLNDFIILTGYLNEEQKNDYYNLSNCFILPTEDLEGFGIVILESYSHNLPVIGTNVGAIPEVIRDVTPDLLVDEPEEYKLAEKIKYFHLIYKNKNFNFVDVLNEKYNWDDIIDKYINQMNSLN